MRGTTKDSCVLRSCCTFPRKRLARITKRLIIPVEKFHQKWNLFCKYAIHTSRRAVHIVVCTWLVHVHCGAHEPRPFCRRLLGGAFQAPILHFRCWYCSILVIEFRTKIDFADRAEAARSEIPRGLLASLCDLTPALHAHEDGRCCSAVPVGPQAAQSLA